MTPSCKIRYVKKAKTINTVTVIILYLQKKEKKIFATFNEAGEFYRKGSLVFTKDEKRRKV